MRVVEIYQYRGIGQKNDISFSKIGFLAFIAKQPGCGGSCREVFGCVRLNSRTHGVLSGDVPSFQGDGMR